MSLLEVMFLEGSGKFFLKEHYEQRYRLQDNFTTFFLQNFDKNLERKRAYLIVNSLGACGYRLLLYSYATVFKRLPSFKKESEAIPISYGDNSHFNLNVMISHDFKTLDIEGNYNIRQPVREIGSIRLPLIQIEAFIKPAVESLFLREPVEGISNGKEFSLEANGIALSGLLNQKPSNIISAIRGMKTNFQEAVLSDLEIAIMELQRRDSLNLH